MQFNLTIVRPKGFLHSSAFLEVRDSLAWSLSALGHEAILTENSFSAEKHTNIIYGAELLPEGTKLPAGSIVFNYEQPTHPRMELVRKLVKANDALVWDFSARNVQNWTSIGVRAVHVPVGYTPNLTRIPKVEVQDFDVCFMGWMTPRRTKIVNDLKAAGLKVYASDSCYGGSRDNILSRSKVVLNVHHDGRDMFEIVRVSYFLSNSKCVVAETSSDDSDYSFLGGIVRNDYDGILTSIKSCVENYCDARTIQEKLGFEIFSKQDYVATVAAALGEDRDGTAIASAQPIISSGDWKAKVGDPIRQRYDRACREGDMKDFMKFLMQNAKGNILEIGTRDGASTSAFLVGLEYNGGHLTSIDVDDCSALWKHPQWTFIRGNSLDLSFHKLFHDGQFDIALIDGDHRRAAFIGDLYNCYHWVKSGGMILCHDIVPQRGHEFYAVGLREEWRKFGVLYRNELQRIYELDGKYGMGVFVKK